MTNKYYTPEIEEFHVGFECEFKNIMQSNKWEKEICDVGIMSIAYDSFEHEDYKGEFANIFRVKYLDKEDIESLEFHTEDSGECYNKSIGWMVIGLYPWEDMGGKPNEYKIVVDNNTNFHGIIKNKSELKKILKQLNIL